MSKEGKRYLIPGFQAPMSRYLKLSPTSGAKPDLLEILGSVTFGSAVVPRYQSNFSDGLRGDMRALGYDYEQVLRRRTTAAGRKGVAAE